MRHFQRQKQETGRRGFFPFAFIPVRVSRTSPGGEGGPTQTCADLFPSDSVLLAQIMPHNDKVLL